jgi:hypothetical protein
MRFVFIDSLGIEPQLAILTRTTQPHSILLYQHTGNVQADHNEIGNRTPVIDQLNAVINKARDESADLLLTPEYCCPWEVIGSVVSAPERWPRAGKLWVLGCESITLANLDAFINANSQSGTHIHIDQNVRDRNGNYLDPLVYLFRASYQGVDKLIVLIQFKTHHMGVWSSTIERNNLIRGDDIFILRNSPNSVYLLTLICAEAMNFPQEFQPHEGEFQWPDMPYLILNPQLNPDPLHDDFLNFRKYISRHDKKQLISLNWSKISTILGHPFARNNTSRSGIYLRSAEVDLSHQRIKQNHRHGMYYFAMGHNKHAYILNSSVDAFLIRITSVNIVEGVPPQQRHDGPQVVSVFRFNTPPSNLEAYNNDIPDYHIPYLISVYCPCQFLLDPANCIIEKEMLVSLTTANVTNGGTWSDISNLYSLRSDEQTEVNNRITFIEDSYPANVVRRTSYIDTLNTIQNQIFANPALFPESINDLKLVTLKIGYHPNSKHDKNKYNITTDHGEEKRATICYLGSAPDAEIELRFIALQQMFDRDNMNRARVVIFYQRGNEIRAKSDLSAARIGATVIHDPSSILK